MDQYLCFDLVRYDSDFFQDGVELTFKQGLSNRKCRNAARGSYPESGRARADRRRLPHGIDPERRAGGRGRNWSASRSENEIPLQIEDVGQQGLGVLVAFF